MNAIKKQVVQKPVEVSINEQVLEITNDGRPSEDMLLIAGHGDRGIKFLHLQANQNGRAKVASFCQTVEDSGHEVIVIGRDLLDKIVSGEACIHDSDDH
jgi:hypothetical protein